MEVFDVEDATGRSSVSDVALQDSMGWMGWMLPALGGRPLAQIRELTAALTEKTAAGVFRPVAVSQVNWPCWAGAGVAPLAYRALLSTTPDADRETLVAALRVWATTPFVTRPECFRYIWIADEPGWQRRTVVHAATGSFYVGPPVDDPYPSCRRLIQYSPDGRFASAHPMTVLGETEPFSPRWSTAANITRCLEVLAARGPISWAPDDVEWLAGRLGVSATGAAVLMAGLPVPHDDGSGLDGTTRAMTGLPASALVVALDEMSSPPEVMTNFRVFEEALPADVEELWSRAGYRAALGRLAGAWTAMRAGRGDAPVSAETR